MENSAEGFMGLKLVHINRPELSRKAEAKAMWENVLKPKWEEQVRENGLNPCSSPNVTAFKSNCAYSSVLYRLMSSKTGNPFHRAPL